MGGVGRTDSTAIPQGIGKMGGASNTAASESLAQVRGTGAFAPGELRFARRLYDVMLPKYRAALDRLRDAQDPVPAAATAVTAFTTVCIGLVEDLREAGANEAQVVVDADALHADLVAFAQRLGVVLAEANEAGNSLKGARELEDAIVRGQDAERPVPTWIVDACFRTHPTE